MGPAMALPVAMSCPRFETNVGVMTRPSIFICRVLLSVVDPGSSICPVNPSVANAPIRLRLGVFVVACGLLDSGSSYGVGIDVQPIFSIGL